MRVIDIGSVELAVMPPKPDPGPGVDPAPSAHAGSLANSGVAGDPVSMLGALLVLLSIGAALTLAGTRRARSARR